MNDIDLYVSNTANGVKAVLAMEEFGKAYTLRKVNLFAGEHLTPEYQEISPVGRIPALKCETFGGPMTLYGSEAIALCLADMTGQFLPAAYPERGQVLEMASFATSDLAGPLAVQFHADVLIAGDQSVVSAYYVAQARRMLETLERQIARYGYVACDDYSIADMLVFPAVHISAARTDGLLDGLAAVADWQACVAARPAVQRALAVKLD